ncbi:MAG: hypothetical protein UX91_C0005G0011 [Candidatus Amesbacteria bacterium GW2011_GWB1_47_19]|nr:MAG: hypothetical protein UW51_C0007G0011 [Candidatus Amesbacteria bacterium GW2011_GWA1_44_24]KKU31093.1 MAG: hypothetical protein UX46_C0007G0011 [Candidatus Amesbacteria bacterium GW2011_GWC1_46_24]KKU67214.1 MAG: hypothetical protein UX91_C0005G0011 [Candidatus Amesbacteria bacterium GW2011_GWB1_47_19]OGD05774.1 MAG: hypothetical protein A2379_01455 [Candidatus Amesbacteria bacterium RIFOXYB1_FULL_47_13]HBC72630.1 hypothetical protein [Candidatus Amesbacteria bacterium]
MEDFLKFLVTPLLTLPQELVIIASDNQINLKVADADTGRVIGKHGNVINAVRTLLRTYCATHQIPPVNLVLETPPLPKKD